MPEQRFVLAVPWTIDLTFSAVAAGATGYISPSTNVGPYNFVWTRLSLETANATGVFTLMLKDEADSKNFMLNAVRTSLLVPRDGYMVDLPRPWVFKAHTTIYAEATNQGGAVDTLYIALHGYLEQ